MQAKHAQFKKNIGRNSPKNISNKEQNYPDYLDYLKNDFLIFKITGDGNCIPRSVSFLLFGTENFYLFIKGYISLEKMTNYFDYLQAKSYSFDEEMKICMCDCQHHSDLFFFVLSNLLVRPIVLFHGKLSNGKISKKGYVCLEDYGSSKILFIFFYCIFIYLII